jgi:pyruvate dehydrogenase (quinone)
MRPVVATPLTGGTQMASTVADLLVERLVAWEVDTIFGLPGDGINGIFEALRTRQQQVKFIQVRHEEASAFAACGYALATIGTRKR